MRALSQAVRQGKALYVGISSYSAEKSLEAARLLREMGTPLLIHQPSYSMLNRWIERGLTEALKKEGLGAITFSPLGQGLLTEKYLNGIPADSRAGSEGNEFDPALISEENLRRVRALNEIAKRRGQSLAQMALAWNLRLPQVASVLVGASSSEQIEENVRALENLSFSKEELAEIDQYAVDGGINLWAASSEAG
jgi:L-glyceraldehyde 3-phosphate reductase